jgi:hypothetical protein
MKGTILSAYRAVDGVSRPCARVAALLAIAKRPLPAQYGLTPALARFQSVQRPGQALRALSRLCRLSSVSFRKVDCARIAKDVEAQNPNFKRE